MEEFYDLQTLPNGVRIVTEHVPAVRSACLGLWVGTGSRHEKAGEGGAAHFIEHMAFKGTDRRTARQLAQEMDAIGGQINAYTTKECTCFYARCLDDHLDRAADILCDMVFHSRFDEGDVQTERGVILEEIGMYEDNPEDLCAERLSAAVYRGTPLGRPILGRKATLDKMTGAWLKDYMTEHYRPENLVVALAGSFSPLAVEELKARFIGLERGAPRTLMLGSGMSSRLWQELREKRGLCYSVYTYGAGHAETGLFAVYTALSQETETQALETICALVREFAEHGPGPEELDRARELSKANVLMGLESTQSRMSALGRGTLLQDRALTTDEVIAAYDAVTAEDVRDLAGELFDFQRASLSVVGRVGGEERYRSILGQ